MVNLKGKYPFATTRVGIIFVAVALVIGACGTNATMLDANANLHQVLWIASLAACSLGGIVAMKSLRTLRTIESEIRYLGDAKTSTPDKLVAARAVISSDPVAGRWNDLLDLINQAGHLSSAPRETAPLDRQVVTLARAMRSLPVAWAITDNEGSIRQISGAACAMLAAADPDDLIGTPLIELFRHQDHADADPADAKNDDEPNDRLQKVFGKLLSELRHVNQDLRVEVAGQPLDVRIVRSRIVGRLGDGEGFSWVFSDLTKQRAAIESRDQFLMTATHELRSPLTNLQAYAEALVAEDSLELDQQKDFCNTICSEANRLGRLIDQLLAVSQMEAGAIVVSQAEIEVLPMLDDAISQLQPSAQQKNLSLTAELPSKMPTIFGDRSKLQAALINLIANAVKYTQAGGNVRLVATSDQTNLSIAVEDDGPGIAAEEQDRVFDKFYRCASAAESEHSGNGIGLAFSREIVRLHGGDITLQSEPGQGSTFTISLPVGGRSRSGL